MSEYINASSTNNDLGLISSRKYENDNLISPREPLISPNITIFSQLESMQKFENQNTIQRPFSPKSRDDFDNFNMEGEILKYNINSQGNKFKKQISSNVGSLNYLNQRDSSLEQSPERIRVLDESSSDKTQLDTSQKKIIAGIKRTSSISNKLESDKKSIDKIVTPKLVQEQSSILGMGQQINENAVIQNENNTYNIKNKEDIIGNIIEGGIQDNNTIMNNNNNDNTNNNNGVTNNNNNNNSSSQGNGNSNPTTSQKQINDSIDFQRKVSNYSSKTQQYNNTPRVARRNLKTKKNLTCATTIGLSPPPGTPLKGKNRVFPQIGGSIQNSPQQSMLASTPQQSQRENAGGYSKSIYNSMRKTQRLGGDNQQSMTTSQILQKEAISPTHREPGQILFSNGTLNTQFERKNTLFNPYVTNTQNELILQSQNLGTNFLKKWSIATRVKMINRFYQKVKNQTSQINFKYLTKSHFDLIDDSSCFMFDESNTRINNEQKSTLGKFLQMFYLCKIKMINFPVLSPNATLITYWRLFYTFLLLLQMFLIPFQISFSIVFNSDNEAFLLFYAPLVIYILNIAVCLNTGYYEMGIEQLNRSKVFSNYKYQLVLDILVSISFVLTNTLEQPFFNVLFYLKFHQLISYFQDIVEYYKIHKKFSHAYTLAKLAFLILFIAHACGCIFQFISIQEIESGNQSTWLVQTELADATIQKRYLNSLYFSIITMITVGYGDIKPIADSEKMFIIFMTLLGSVIFAYVVNTIGGIFQEIAQKEAEFTKKKYDLSIYMSARQIKSEIQLRVMKFLDYKRLQEEDNPMRGEYLLDQLSENLKEEIQKDFYGRILQQTKVFSSKFSHQFLTQVSIHFKEKVLGPGEIIFRQESYGENDIYFVLKGTVEIFLQSGTSTRHISSIKAGSFFGQGGFFSSAPRESSCKSTSTTHVLVLPQNKFIETLKDFPQDFETYCQIKDEMVLYNKKESMACLSCGKYNHSLVNCHYIHYRRNRDLLIARYTYSVPNERKGYNRFTKTISTLQKNQTVRNDLKKLRQDIINRMVDEHQEQLDDDDTDKNLPIHNRVQLTNIHSDKKFFQKAKKIKLGDKQIVAYSDDEDFDSSLGEITECSYHSSQYEQSESYSDYGDEDDDIEEADIDEEESHTQNEIQGELLQRKDEDVLNSIQEEGEDGNDESKKNSQSRHSSSANIYREKLSQFMINLQQEGKLKSTQLIDQNYNDNLSKQDASKLGISELSSSRTESSNSNSSDQESSDEKGESSDSDSEKSKSFIRSRSESSPTNLFENTISGTNLQPPSERQKSKSVIKQKKKKGDYQKKGSQHRTPNSGGDSKKISRENSNNSSMKRDNDRLQNTGSSGQKKNHSRSKSKNNSSGQDSINRQTDKGSGSASSKKKKRQNATQSSKNTSNNQSNASSIQSNSQIIQQVLKGNILKSLNNSNQSSFINNTNSLSFGNTTNNNVSSNKKRNQPNLNIQVKNQLSSLHKKEGILDEINQSKNYKFQQKFISQDSDISKRSLGQQNSITFAASQQLQGPSASGFNSSNQELNNLLVENIDDFNVDSNSINNFLMIQNLSNQNIEADPNYNINTTKIDQFEFSKQTPKKVIQNGFFKFGSLNYDEEEQQQQSQQQQNPQQQSQLTSKFKQSQNTPRNQTMGQLKQEYPSFAQSSITNNKNRSQSSASAPNQALDKLKKKSLLSREQSYRSLQSKISRESKLLQVQEIDELFQNKKPGQHNNTSQQQTIGFSKFSSALSDWNATPILKHINGIMGNNNNYDQESSISLGGFNTPGRSIKGFSYTNRNSLMSNPNYMDEEENSSPYQHPTMQQQMSNPSNNSQQQQQQQLQQQSFLNKKSKFAPGTQPRRPSITQHIEGENQTTENQGIPSQNESVLPNIEKIRKEQERLRRNSPFLMSRHPLSVQSGLNPPRNSIRLSNDITSLASHRNSQLTSTFGHASQVQSQSGGNNNSTNQIQNQNSISNNNNINNVQNSLQQNNNYQNNINEDLLSRLKELFQQRNQDDDKSNDAPTKRGSTMFGSEQNFYMQNPLYFDYNMIFFPDFDFMKEYENYFVHNNPSEVLKKFKGKQKLTRRTKTQVNKRKAILLHTQSITAFGKID